MYYRHLNYAKIEIGGKNFTIINVHLDCSEDYDFKEIEAKCFLEIIKNIVGTDEVIMFGDFNLIADDNLAYQTIEKEFIDVSKVCEVREPTHPNWLMRNVYKQLDYIWVSDNIKKSIKDFVIVKDTYIRKD